MSTVIFMIIHLLEPALQLDLHPDMPAAASPSEQGHHQVAQEPGTASQRGLAPRKRHRPPPDSPQCLPAGRHTHLLQGPREVPQKQAGANRHSFLEDSQNSQQLERCSQGLIYAININLSTFNLIHCEVKDTLLSLKDMQLLAQGIQKSSNLKELFIQNCQLTSQHLAQISEALQNCQSLIVVDFSHNNLDDGMLIGKIVSAHSSRRDQIKWSNDIRGDDEQVDNQLALQGLCEISIHNNKIDTKAIKDLCQFLLYDQWTKSIGLRGNLIDEEGTQLLNELLDTNESLISLDLRDNPGFNLPVSKEIFDKLVRNIRMFKESKMMDDEEESENDDGINYNDINAQHINNLPIQEVQDEEEQQFECQNCQKIQQENLKLQYENVNLQMQIKQLAQGETNLYSQQYKVMLRFILIQSLMKVMIQQQKSK